MKNSNVISKKPTLIERAQLQLTEFDVLWHRLEQAITLGDILLLPYLIMVDASPR